MNAVDLSRNDQFIGDAINNELVDFLKGINIIQVQFLYKISIHSLMDFGNWINNTD